MQEKHRAGRWKVYEFGFRTLFGGLGISGSRCKFGAGAFMKIEFRV